MEKDSCIVETERLSFREINENDTDEIVKWRSDPEVYRYFKFPHEINREEHIAWFNNVYSVSKNRLDLICIEKKSENKIGVFGFKTDFDTAEINYLLAPEAQHKGYAKEGICAIIGYVKKAYGIHTMIAEIHKENKPSIAVIEKVGFERKSENGVFLIYGIEV